VEEGKAISYRNTNFGAKLNSSPRFSSDDGPNMTLNQVDNAVGNAACLSVQEDAVLSVWLTDHEQFMPSMRLQLRKSCLICDQGVNGIKIMPQIAKLEAYSAFIF
jgi:hypothetical protein